MEKDKDGVVDVDKRNKRKNIIQLIRKNEMIYGAKLVIFIVATILIIGDMQISTGQMKTMDNHMFASCTVFLLTTFIDELILLCNGQVKNEMISNIQAILVAVIFAGLAFVFLIVFGAIQMPLVSVLGCYFFTIVCCLSPILEALFDLTIRVQNEEDNGV